MSVDEKLMTRVEQTVVSPIGLKTLADHVKENHLNHFLTLQLRCFARMDRRRRHCQPSPFPEHNELMPNPPRFSRFDDEAGFNGRCPSAAVLQSAFVAVMEGMEHWYHRQQHLVDGRNLALDDSHKVTKGIRVMNSKVFHGVHTVLNEHSQVVMQCPKRHVGVGNLSEISGEYKALAQRYRTQGFPLIQVCYADNCCGDRKRRWGDTRLVIGRREGGATRMVVQLT